MAEATTTTDETTTTNKNIIKKEISVFTRPMVIPERYRRDTTISSFVLFESTAPEKTVNPDYDYIQNNVYKVITPVTLSGDPAEEGIPKTAVSNLVLGAKSNVNADGPKENYYGVFNNVIITDVSEAYSTIQKLHLNFSNSWNVFFFNNNPITVTVSGHFLDTHIYPYYQEFMEAYDKFLCSTSVASSHRNLVLTYDGKLLEGYILSVAVSTTATHEVLKSFQMTFLVKKVTWIRHNHVRSDVDPYYTISDDSDKINSFGNKGRIKMETGYSESKSYQDIIQSHLIKEVEWTPPPTYEVKEPTIIPVTEKKESPMDNGFLDIY